ERVIGELAAPDVVGEEFEEPYLAGEEVVALYVGKDERLRHVVMVDAPASPGRLQPLEDGRDVIDAEAVVDVTGRGPGVDEDPVRPRGAGQRGEPPIAEGELPGQRGQGGDVLRREASHDAVGVGGAGRAPGVVDDEAVVAARGRKVGAGRSVDLLAHVAD